MANRVTGDLIQGVAARCRWILGAACAAMLLACGGGQGDVAVGANTNDAAAGSINPSDATATGDACERTIALDAPRAVGASDRIALAWQGPSFSSFSVSIRRAAGQAFEPIDATVSSQSAQFSRGAAYRWDFPTARVRVRGCDGAGQCVDSNEQPLLDALLGSVVEFPSPNAGGFDSFGSGLALSSDGNVLAIAGAAAGTAVGPGDHLHLFERDMQGRWQRRDVLAPAACAQFVVGSATLDGVGATLAVASAPAANCPARAGAIEVFARANGLWQRTARIADEAPPAAQRFSGLSLASDGRTLGTTVFEDAVPWSGRARVYERDDMGRWALAAALAAEASDGLRAAFGMTRLSGNGAVLAIQGAREITNPADPTAPAEPDSFIALFTREASGWIARTTVRSTKPQDCCALAEDNDRFGASLALNHDGSMLAVGAPGDNSDASDRVGDPLNRGQPDSGAVWIFRRTGEAVWSQQAFIKAPAGTEPGFFLGTSVALDRDGRVLAATVIGNSRPSGVNRNQAADRQTVIEPSVDTASFGGAAYLFVLDDTGRWTQRALVIPPLEPRTRKTLFDAFSMAFAADATALVLGVQANTQEGMPVATSVFVY